MEKSMIISGLGGSIDPRTKPPSARMCASENTFNSPFSFFFLLGRDAFIPSLHMHTPTHMWTTGTTTHLAGELWAGDKEASEPLRAMNSTTAVGLDCVADTPTPETPPPPPLATPAGVEACRTIDPASSHENNSAQLRTSSHHVHIMCTYKHTHAHTHARTQTNTQVCMLYICRMRNSRTCTEHSHVHMYGYTRRGRDAPMCICVCT